MNCHRCGTPLNGNEDTFGTIHNPLCIRCWFDNGCYSVEERKWLEDYEDIEDELKHLRTEESFIESEIRELECELEGIRDEIHEIKRKLKKSRHDKKPGDVWPVWLKDAVVPAEVSLS